MGFVVARKNEDLRKRFCTPLNKHDGFRVEDYINRERRKLMHSMVPIFSPDKPTTCTMKLTLAILESFSGKLQCSWGRILDKILNQEVGKMGSIEPTSLGTFLFHLYVKNMKGRRILEA